MQIFYVFRSQSDRDAALDVQLTVFDEENARDAEQLPGPAGVDLNSHLDVFHAVLKQVKRNTLRCLIT